MILSAGRGSRMGALTDHVPKPLLKVNDRHLIEYSIFSLTKIGVTDIVINISYHGEQIKQTLGNGSRYQANFHYSEEPEALETGGGILQALPLLGDAPFIVLSSDVITDFPLEKLPREPEQLAHLILVDNPDFHPRGDFCLDEKKIYCQEQNTFTFANIGVYRRELFDGCRPGKFRLGDLLKAAAKNSKLSGECYRGLWHNMGRPEDLARCFISSRNPI